MFRKRRATVSTAVEAASWKVYQGEHDGKELFARFNAALANASDRASYPIQIGVALPLNAPDDRGLPQSAEMDELAAIEELLVEMVGTHAVLVGVITTSSMREFVLYSPEGSWIPEFHADLQREVQSHRIDAMARTDADWSVYRSFVSD